MRVSSRWVRLHIYIILVSFMILWCQSLMIALENAKDPVLSVSDSVAITSSVMRKSLQEEKLDRVGLVGWAIIGFGIFTVGLFGLQNSLWKRKRSRRYVADTGRYTYRQTKSSRTGELLSSRVSMRGGHQKYGRNIEMRR